MISHENRRILAHLGMLVLGIGVLTLTPLLAGLLMPLHWEDALPFLVTGLGSIVAGWSLWQGYRLEANGSLSPREAAVIMSVGWLLATVVGGLPFLIGKQLVIVDSLYEAISGWTGTGLSMFPTTEPVPPIYLFWRSIMSYLGGAGFAVLMLSAVIGPQGIGLYQAEARSDHLVPSILDTARLFMKMYGLYLVVGTILYQLVGLSLFDAVNHAMTALSAAGFSTHTQGIAFFKSLPVELVTIILMLLGSSNFSLHYLFYTKRDWRVLKDSEVYALAVVLGLLIPLAYIGIGSLYGDIPRAWRIATFQAISASTTTGFGTADLSKWPDISLFALTLLMIAGGGTGGTAGGIKLSRIAALWQAAVWTVRHRIYGQRVIVRHTVYRQGELKSISDRELLEAAVIVFLYVVTFLSGTVIFMIHGVPLAWAGLEFATALSTVGLSVGITGPSMPLALKITQMLGMWLGRLEFIAVMVALSLPRHI